MHEECVTWYKCRQWYEEASEWHKTCNETRVDVKQSEINTSTAN